MANLLIGRFANENEYHQMFIRWTFAVLCFEMAAGQPPFSGKDHTQLYEYVKKDYIDFSRLIFSSERLLINVIIVHHHFPVN